MGSTSEVDRLYGAGVNGNLMQDRYLRRERVVKALQKRHRRSDLLDDDNCYEGWKVPYGVRFALRRPLVHSQLVSKYPWYVTWRSPKDGSRKKKYHMSLIAAIHFTATRATRVDPQACIVSRVGYDIPPPLRGKLPKGWKWCPCCMAPRKYARIFGLRGDPETFYGHVKVRVWSDKRRKYIWEFQERKLALMRCPFCGLTNRDGKFRRSNQPWEKRRVKRGKRKVRRRHVTPRQVANNIHWRRQSDTARV